MIMKFWVILKKSMPQTLVENLSLTLDAKKAITFNNFYLLPDDEIISKQKTEQKLFPNFSRASFEIEGDIKLEIGSLIRLIFVNNNYGLVEITNLESKDKTTLVKVAGLFSPNLQDKEGLFNLIRFQRSRSSTFINSQGKALKEVPTIYDAFSAILNFNREAKVAKNIDNSLIKLMPIAFLIRKKNSDYFFFSFTEKREELNKPAIKEDKPSIKKVIYHCRVLHSDKKFWPSAIKEYL